MVSIIMPAFNSALHIGEAISSVQKQSFNHWELLIVDGGSSDQTLEIVESISKGDHRLRLIKNLDDRGPAHARSVGVRSAQSKYIAFLDADDLWMPSKLLEQIHFMESTSAKFSYTKFRKMDSAARFSTCPLAIYSSYGFWTGLSTRGIGTLTVIASRELFTEKILSTNSSSHGEETLWWLMMFRDGARAVGLAKTLAFYRNTPGSLSKYVWRNQIAVWENYRNEFSLGIFIASLVYVSYVADVFFRRALNLICTKVKGPTSVSAELNGNLING
jgi:teichuronic acid biosynthesis glycosyltransferase TuaG